MGTHQSVWQRWESHALSTPDREAIVHWTIQEAPIRWTWEALLMEASRFASIYKLAGVKPGDVCALIVRHHSSFYSMYMAVSALGAVPAVLAYPNSRLHPDKFRQGLQGMAEHSGLDWLITEKELEPMIAPLVSDSKSTIKGILYPLDRSFPDHSELGATFRPEKDIHSPCLLQHSSGTTGLQKAVVLSHPAVLEHVENYARAIELKPSDRIVSWLPLYHDMGLIAAFYLPLTMGVTLVQLDPFEWVMAPVIFLQAISDERGTLAWLPNFAYNLMANQIRSDDIPPNLSLASLRMVVNCSESVRADSHDRFYSRFAQYGFRREALSACYAMAETTFAVTQTVPGEEACRIFVSREAMASEKVVATSRVEATRVCVSSGRLISGTEVRIIDDNGADVLDDTIGEIAIKSSTMFSEYRNNPEATQKSLKDGWFFSGDFGFQRDNEIYVVGRKKDIIIVAGKNLYPEDIEDAIGQVPNVIPGRVVAFGCDDERSGTEQVCVVAETALTEKADLSQLRRSIITSAMQIDVSVSRVYLVPPKWLIKSSSGKPSRKANRERALTELDWR